MPSKSNPLFEAVGPLLEPVPGAYRYKPTRVYRVSLDGQEEATYKAS